MWFHLCDALREEATLERRNRSCQRWRAEAEDRVRKGMQQLSDLLEILSVGLCWWLQLSMFVNTQRTAYLKRWFSLDINHTSNPRRDRRHVCWPYSFPRWEHTYLQTHMVSCKYACLSAIIQDGPPKGLHEHEGCHPNRRVWCPRVIYGDSSPAGTLNEVQGKETGKKKEATLSSVTDFLNSWVIKAWVS